MSRSLASEAMLGDLRDFLDASPSPWHVVASARTRLETAGFEEVALDQPWPTTTPIMGYAVRGAAIVAWRLARDPQSFRIVGAHSDSPCLRIKPNPDVGGFGWRQLGVEVYGGALLNSWLDRDLGVAGRVVLGDGGTALVRIDRPLARIPQLAIHLDREVNERGLLLDKQLHLTPVWGVGSAAVGGFASWLTEAAALPSAPVGWDLCLYDLTPSAVLGGDSSLLASGRLDNQLSCWAALEAISTAARSPHDTSVIALFDHEEVGSDSTTGAGGPLLEHLLERLAAAGGMTRDAFLASLQRSWCVSADNAHAVHPNYPERHEPGHRPMVNSGPAIKINSNQRYATTSVGAALLQRCFDAVNVPWQTFVSRNNMPCGSTIGPITATRLGIETIDVGVPQLSMHSARELCGTHDAPWLAQGLTGFLAGQS
jgi:aspartyl aminopeptidase